MLEGQRAKPARATFPSMTLDGGRAEALQPLQGGAVPAARVELVLALEDSQLWASFTTSMAPMASTCRWQMQT